MNRGRQPRAARPGACPGCRGQALVELALLAGLLLLLLLVPVAAVRWAEQRLAVLAAARHAAWEATVTPPGRPAAAPFAARVTLARDRSGRVRATATVEDRRDAHAGQIARLPGPGALRAAVELHVVPLTAGTEAAGRTAVERQWLGGPPARPLRALLRRLLGEDPIRVDFDARPEASNR